MGLKVGDSTGFYDLKQKKKVNAKITQISKSKGRTSAHAKSQSGTKLRKFIPSK